MKKLFIGILSVLCLITLCAGLTACAKDKTEEDKLREQGYLDMLVKLVQIEMLQIY